ncbi:MAG: hypothetical protein Q9159_007547, partial [Coniocarpon cinnabarinum]
MNQQGLYPLAISQWVRPTAAAHPAAYVRAPLEPFPQTPSFPVHFQATGANNSGSRPRLDPQAREFQPGLFAGYQQRYAPPPSAPYLRRGGFPNVSEQLHYAHAPPRPGTQDASAMNIAQVQQSHMQSHMAQAQAQAPHEAQYPSQKATGQERASNWLVEGAKSQTRRRRNGNPSSRKEGPAAPPAVASSGYTFADVKKSRETVRSYTWEWPYREDLQHISQDLAEMTDEQVIRHFMAGDTHGKRASDADLAAYAACEPKVQELER